MLPALLEAYRRLHERFGPQEWWPGDSPFEVVVGAVLVQNTAWKNVERAIARLRDAGLLAPEPMYRLGQAELEEWIRPAGYYRVKARRLRGLLEFLFARYGGSLETWFSQEPARLRGELLALRGIGPETADAILLYAAGQPAFVVDAYARRVLFRHEWIEPEADYYAVQELFTSQLPEDAALFNEYHALLVRLGKECCRTRPVCEGCPLEALLPDQGPRLEA